MSRTELTKTSFARVRIAIALASFVLALGFSLGGIAVANPSDSSLRVFAAASLTDVLPAIDDSPTYNFAGSNALATQIRNGAPADIFLSADTELPSLLNQQGYVATPINFTRNSLVVVVPKSNPAGIKSIYDLAKPGVKVVVASGSVPVGRYTQQVLRQMGLSSKVTSNIVSNESDVRSVLAKVALRQGDAGFVYSTDARTVGSDVTVIKVPAWAQPKITYAMAIVTAGSNRAAAESYMNKMLSERGQRIFVKFGFLRLTATGPSVGVTKVKLVRRTARVRRGKVAAVTVSYPVRRRSCAIVVTNPSGHRAGGLRKVLVRKRPNAAGRITWRWRIARRATTGRWTIRVNCGPAPPQKLTTRFLVTT